MSPEEKNLKALKDKLDQLEQRRPASFQGRELYVKELCMLAREWKEQGRDLEAGYQHRIFKCHTGQWSEMSDARREQYHRRAVPYRKQQEQQLLSMGAQLRGEC